MMVDIPLFAPILMKGFFCILNCASVLLVVNDKY